MSRQHLAVGIDIDSLILRLLQQLLQVIQIMTGDHDERSLLHFQRDSNGNGIAKGFRVGFVQHLHAGEVDLTDFQHDGKQLIHTPVFTDGKERLGNKLIDFVTGISEDSGMIGIGSHTTDAEEDQRLQGTDILIRVPDFRHVIIVVSAARRTASRAVRHDLFLLRMNLVD